MAEEVDHYTTIVSVTGVNNNELHFLANLSPPVDAPESIWSVIGELSHRPGVSWRRLYRVHAWLTSMDQSEGGFLFAVSMDGELHYYKGGTWAVMDLGCRDGLNKVWAVSDDELFAVGLKGERVRVFGNSVAVVRDAEGRRLNAVHGTSPKNVYAVGDNGLIFQYDGTAWNELDAPTNYTLLTVLCRSETETYVAGSNGILFRSNGIEWEKLEAPEEIIITSLAWYHNALYAAAGKDGVWMLGSNSLQKIKDRRLYVLRTINDLLFGAGNRYVVQFDGSVWWGGDLDL